MGTRVAPLICLLLGAARTVQAQTVAGDMPKAKKNADVCMDVAQPPATRVDGCTYLLDETFATRKQQAGLLNNRGNALNGLGKVDAAMADFTRAIQLDPRDLIAYASRATLYLNTNRPDLANADLAQLLRIDPANGTAFYNRGVAHQRSGELKLALDDYGNAVRLLPDFAPAHLALGALLKTTEPNAALTQFSEALRIDPGSPAILMRANLYLAIGQPQQALRDFDQAIARDPANGLSYLNRGVASQALDDPHRALADFTRSIELARSAIGYVDRARVYLQLQQEDEALADFNAALAIEPKNLAALSGRADLYLTRGALQASIDDYTRVIEIEPNNPAAFFKRGNVYSDQRRFAAAFKDYAVSLKLDPDQPEVLYNRALAAERMGSKADAAADRRRARALERTLPD